MWLRRPQRERNTRSKTIGHIPLTVSRLRLSFAKQALQLQRAALTPLRLRPDFLIIGVQKGGTTSLFNYLAQHPSVAVSTKKEIGYFSGRFANGWAWYLSHFPIAASKLKRHDVITGEADTNYIFHPHSARRIAQTLPQVKIIALLRNPVDRAYSHYRHSVRSGKEDLTFEEALAAEDERLSGVMSRMAEDEYYTDPRFNYHTYRSRGLYLNQLKIWFDLFGRDQLLILKSEDFFSNPRASYKKVLKFLGLPAWQLKEYKIYNVGTCQGMNPGTRQRLVDYYRPHNQRLSKYLEEAFDWDR
jgi:hypothetical protein